jgi:hypothetical protein
MARFTKVRSAGTTTSPAAAMGGEAAESSDNDRDDQDRPQSQRAFGARMKSARGSKGRNAGARC